MSRETIEGVPTLEEANPRLTSGHGADVVGIDWVRRTGLRWDDRDGVVYTLAFMSAERDRWLRRVVIGIVMSGVFGFAAGIITAVG